MSIPANDYYYDQQIRKYLVQFMAIFQGLQVQVGKLGDRDPALIMVPIRYGPQDRVVEWIKSDFTQNKPLRLPIMSAYLRGLELDPSLMVGVGTERRNTVLPSGGLLPDDAKVVYQRRPTPYRATAEVVFYASNMAQMLQMVEQILMLFNPILQIQVSDAPLDWKRITTVELVGIRSEMNYPLGQDRRVLVWTLDFSFPVQLDTPADFRNNIIEKIYMRIGTIQTATTNSYDIISEIDDEGPTVSIIGVDPSANLWTVAGDTALSLVAGDRIQIINNIYPNNSQPTGADGYYTVSSVAPSGSNTNITVNQTIPITAAATGICALPNPYDLIMSSDDLTFQ